MKRKSMLALLIIFAASALMGACGSKGQDNASSPPKASNEKAAEPTPGNKNDPPKEQVFRFNLHSNPPTLDPGVVQDNVGMAVLNGLYEGLTRSDENGKVLSGTAENWDVSPDGLKYIFHLHKDAKWSNGDPVTAADFEFEWKRVLNPKTEPAPPYAYQMYYIKGAEAYNTGKNTDPNSVAVKAVDANTLEVNLEHSTPYFLSLLSLPTYFPVHSSVKENPKWASNASTIISNGPFKINDWKPQSLLELVKNENYYAKDDIKFTKVQMTMVNDSGSELNMYETNQLDYAGLPTGRIPNEQIPILKQSKPDELEIKGIASTYYYLFNNKQKPFDNVNIRKALTMAIDRQLIVDKVTLGGQLPAFGIVSPGIAGVNGEFRSEHKDDYLKENVEEAKALLQKGLSEEGLSAMPEFTLIYNTDESHKKVAEAVADMWSRNLGIKMKIENQEWGVFLKNRTSLNYQVARSGWSTDYNDPMSFIDLYMTGSGNNDIGYSNPEYDKLVHEAKQSLDNKARMELMAKAERILIEQDQAILPLYYYTNVALKKPNLKNVYVDYQGNIFFSRGYYE
ncbi:peptide ABC transporter substrate-binding protein [Paenibacillus sp.]|jgi:oligopeptide transport system substrate-binding protein|uniref:peptide ABC transporter substrate-binding protein n=1 Tax=Paenibacillus sp. TaxID=58172 RepID=UPI0028309726|nr:peptide ABC transporter substrate-binding protein [Paenibacillus sp.]MDR0266750.1 peptide ABC transporter substrate-binding protein [Paenibacillus sp.]